MVFLSDEVEMEGRKMDLKKWSIFAILEKEFLAQIRLACVFGNLGNEALMISHDDEVNRVNNFISVGHKCSSSSRTKTFPGLNFFAKQ